MNLIGYWRTEDQVRVREYERMEFEEEFCRKGQQDCKDACENGSVAGLQPMVTEAFLQEGDNIQCGLEDMRLEEVKPMTT